MPPGQGRARPSWEPDSCRVGPSGAGILGAEPGRRLAGETLASGEGRVFALRLEPRAEREGAGAGGQEHAPGTRAVCTRGLGLREGQPPEVQAEPAGLWVLRREAGEVLMFRGESWRERAERMLGNRGAEGAVVPHRTRRPRGSRSREASPTPPQWFSGCVRGGLGCVLPWWGTELRARNTPGAPELREGSGISMLSLPHETA